jgi:hypothetical protein
MSTKYTGGFITKSPVAPTTSAASGIWTLDQQQQAQKAGTWPSPPVFIEDLFSTYLYTGDGTAQTITNGIDLSGQGGLVWMKNRSLVRNHNLYDTARGALKQLRSDSNGGQITNASGFGLTAFNANGFSLGTDIDGENFSNVVSWTFRKQPKFFDVVTYTGDSVSGRTVSHNLGTVPGCIIVKNSTMSGTNWDVYHRSLGATSYLNLNTTAVTGSGTGFWNNTAPTASVFTVGNRFSNNFSGETYVAYLFAHDAGGFPVSGGGSTNGISCGSFTSDGSGNATVTLGYEPQWILYKPSSSVGNWEIADIMRGWNNTNIVRLYPDSSAAEGGYTANTPNAPTATGFTFKGLLNTSSTYIYIAIRRGPMKTPTVGTSVFVPQVVAESTTPPNFTNTITSGFPVDWVFTTTSASSRRWGARLIGNAAMRSNSTDAESNFGLSAATVFDSNTSAGIVSTLGSAASAYMYAFRRAPSFFDEVCYTGDGTFDGSYNVTHNLGVVPEFIIAKRRDSTNNWNCYHSGLISATYQIRLNLTTGQQNTGQSWGPTSTTFKPQYAGNADNSSNQSGGTYVAYLFATCAGVSKVGSYTGNGSTQTINCGFTGGARFVLIKRIDDNSDWYTYDTARGMTVLTDPYLLLNSTAAEVATLGSVTTVSTGFAVDAAVLAAINTSAASYIFLAIA